MAHGIVCRGKEEEEEEEEEKDSAGVITGEEKVRSI